MDKTTIILIIAVVVLIGVIVYLVRRYNYNRIMAQVQSVPTREANIDSIIQFEEIRRYQASWGDWYVQIKHNDRIVELRFSDNPTEVQLYDVVKAYVDAQTQAEIVTLEAEDGEII